MRHNTRKTLYAIPDILTAAETLAELEIIAQSANVTLIRASIYKGTSRNINTVSKCLAEIYYNKCAYCENVEHKPEVEHYRPKKAVSDAAGHSGYYWLCYEWSNLLPSCRYCNTEGGKGNKFPIRGIRIERPDFIEGRLDHSKCNAAISPLINELPYLLHPEIDDPKPYFKFYNNGKMEGVDNDRRGEETIKICNLNRDNLKYRRQQVIDDLKDSIEGICFLLENNDLDIINFKPIINLIFQKFQEKQSPNQPFSLMAEYVFEHFIEMIIPLLKESIRDIVVESYNSYLQVNRN